MPARRLPVSPHLSHLKNQAKQLAKAHKAGQVDAFARIKASFPKLSDASVQEILSADFTLTNAQLVIAREYGYPTWKDLAAAVEVSNISPPYSEVSEGNPGLRWILEAIRKVTATDLPVLVAGEVGTGKAYAAKIIHQQSSRKDGPFLQILSTGSSGLLIESDLFGHEKGAFTGAVSTKLGALERARGGTLFLDEIDLLALTAQPRILRFCTDNTFERVGGSELLEADVRLIVGADRDLLDLASEGAFMPELAHLLQRARVDLPALRDRKDEIPDLAMCFARQMADQLKRETPVLDPEAAEALVKYQWPVNARELASRMHRAVVECEGSVITRELVGL